MSEAHNVGVFMRITLVHLDILASDEEKPEVTVLVADGIDPQMIDPPEVLKCRPSSSSASASASLIFPSSWRSEQAVYRHGPRLGPFAAHLFQRRRIRHRQKQLAS